MPILTAVLTHPGLSVGHVLLLMEWMNSNAKNYCGDHTYEKVESKPFDGADVKLKKMIFSVLTSREDLIGKMDEVCSIFGSSRLTPLTLLRQC